MGVVPLCLILSLAGAPADPLAVARAGKPVDATVQTDLGAMTLELDPRLAPQAVTAFMELAEGKRTWLDGEKGQVKRPFYEGLPFDEVIPGFVIEVGDPERKGRGALGFAIPDERSSPPQQALPTSAGTVGLLQATNPQYSGSRLVILLGDAPWLKGRILQIGHVVAGLEVAERISKVPRSARDEPLKPVILKSIRFQQSPPRP